MNEVYKSYFDLAALPGRAIVGGTALARGGLVEIDTIAKRR
jgi:enamine deaminase RidA (YjgF/YER057c/UK114 family)